MNRSEKSPKLPGNKPPMTDSVNEQARGSTGQNDKSPKIPDKVLDEL